MKNWLLLIFASCCLTEAQAQFGDQLRHIAVSPSAQLRNLSAHDLDGDGDMDALATYTSGVFWYENDGSGNFSSGKLLLETDLTELYFTDFGAYPARFADGDGDGLPDVAAGKFWMKNLGGGRFAEPAEAWWQRVSALCDVNADGLPDIVSAYNNNNIVWQRNLGGGTFAVQAGVGGGLGPRIFAVGDMNRDGWEDLAVRADSKFYWYKNLKTNTFERIQLAATAPDAVASGDVDGNGRHDLLLGFATEIRWLECSPSGQWMQRQVLGGSSFGNCLALADMDNDGDTDLFVGRSGGVAVRFRMENNGLFATVPDVLTAPPALPPAMAAFADFDGNGSLDVLHGQTGNDNQPRLVRDVHLGLPAFTAAPVLLGQPFGYFYQMLPADLDSDGDEDLLAADFLYEKIAPGKFADRGKINLPNRDVRLADLDGDGLLDAAYPKNDAVHWQRNLGGLTFGPAIKLDGFVALCKDVGVADFDGDGDLDLCAANGTEALTAFELAIWYENDGAGNFTKHHIEDDISLCSNIAPLDVDADGLLDIALTLGNLQPDIWFRNLGGGQFGPKQPIFAQGTIEPTDINQKMLADLDGDGLTDLAFIEDGYHETELYWFRNLGTGTFSQRISLHNAEHLGSYAAPYFTVFDADGDGLTDIVRTDSYHGRIIFLRGTGSGNFAPAQVIFDAPGLANYMAIARHDVDGDGKRDLVFGETDPGNGGNDAVLWLAGKGNEPPPAAPDCPTEIWYRAQSDIDSFPIRYPNCRHFAGNLILRENPGNNQPTITNLEGFRQLKTIGGGLFIWRSRLQNLHGLDSLESIGTHLEITYNIGNLTSVESLSKLARVGGSVEIGGNQVAEFNNQPSLKSLRGLENLRRVGGHFRLFQQGVKSLDGLAGLDFVGKNFSIHSDSLRDLRGLENLDTVGNSLILFELKRLQTLTGLENLRHAGLQITTDSLQNLEGLDNWQSGRELVLANNKLLENLDGLENLQRLVGQTTAVPVLKNPTLQLSANPKLADLSALDHAVSIAPDGLFIFQNPLLTDCAVQAICDLLPAPPDTVFIAQNGPNCSSETQVSLACNPNALTATLSGGDEICLGESLDLTVSFTGDAPFTFVLAENGVPQPPVTTAENPHTFSVSPTNWAVFSLQNVSNAQGSGSVSGSVSAMVWPVPTAAVAGPDTICLGDSAVLTASGSLKYRWDTGATTAQITVQPAATTTYTVTVSNAYNCPDVAAWTVVVKDCTSGVFSAGNDSESTGFQVFPNPLPGIEPLQILLENDFAGQVKIEILSLDGRVLRTIFREKTARREVFGLRDWPVGGASFFVRVSDGKSSEARLVLCF
ncbi:MAG: FG-GAP-like repeat-containing protein [Saprospiraceae bacterium]